ncbi:2'-5' RNA ligase family protein [Mesorhizobium sp. B1-1-8]|uniref:2'-5' RNA ligase family protein n=1 Tax=Mesorhizobium sp. B1-1-8 TaxID=2589976 RepID=UPI0011279D72|nr:2'-5' RNA ligase family protein [Mesorhizobium sp. B1-1-8]UCI06985.1 2'-5' RNA ligase family protein [Mesorhizobium sp. B1-1-8]
MDELPSFGIGKNGQTFFRWGEPDLHRNDRLFFAILLESTVALPLEERAAVWQRDLQLRGKLIPAKQMHISLVGLGDHDGLPRPLVDAACCAGALVRAHAFNVSFDRLSAFGGGALVLRGSDGIPPLQTFWRSLGAVLIDSPLKPFVATSFEPHITLLRDKARVPKVDERPIEPIGWTVRDFVLIHSFLRQGRYQICGRWQLSSQDDVLAVM